MLIEKDIKRVVHIHIPVQFVILSDYYWTWCFTDHHRFLLSRCLWLLLGFMHHQEKLMPSNPVSDFCVASFICLMIDNKIDKVWILVRAGLQEYISGYEVIFCYNYWNSNFKYANSFFDVFEILFNLVSILGKLKRTLFLVKIKIIF